MIKKILLGLALTSGLMMANTTVDLLSLATTDKTAGTALEMNKADMVKANGGISSSYYRYMAQRNYRNSLAVKYLYGSRNSTYSLLMANYRYKKSLFSYYASKKNRSPYSGRL